MNPYDEAIKRLSDLRPFIEYLKKTDDCEWQLDKVRNTENTTNCVMGHLVNWYYGKDFEGNISPAWDMFEEMWATTYMIYPVNDGNTPAWMNFRYEQSTAKDRIIAYLEALMDGREKTTVQLMDEDSLKVAK